MPHPFGDTAVMSRPVTTGTGGRRNKPGAFAVATAPPAFPFALRRRDGKWSVSPAAKRRRMIVFLETVLADLRSRELEITPMKSGRKDRLTAPRSPRPVPEAQLVGF